MDSFLGKIIMVGDQNGLRYLSLIKKIKIDYKNFIYDKSFFLETKRQLKAYFAGELKSFDLKLNPQGSEFFKLVWREIQKIPFAQTVSYSDIAFKISRPRSQRAVGMAANKNPIQFIIPCHRVIGKNGKLVGYNGGISVKDFLINLEKKYLVHK